MVSLDERMEHTWGPEVESAVGGSQRCSTCRAIRTVPPGGMGDRYVPSSCPKVFAREPFPSG